MLSTPTRKMYADWAYPGQSVRYSAAWYSGLTISRAYDKRDLIPVVLPRRSLVSRVWTKDETPSPLGDDVSFPYGCLAISDVEAIFKERSGSFNSGQLALILVFEGKDHVRHKVKYHPCVVSVLLGSF